MFYIQIFEYLNFNENGTVVFINNICVNLCFIDIHSELIFI